MTRSKMSLRTKENSYKELWRPNHVVCDFCDKEFKNRYESIVHNASHIIIPLWIQSFHKCDICNIYLTSLEEYENHKSTHHFTETKHAINGICVTKNESPIKVFKNKCKSKKNVNESHVKIENEIEINAKHVDESIRNRIKFEDDSFSNEVMNDLVNDCEVSLQVCNPAWSFYNYKRVYLGYNKDGSENEYKDDDKKDVINESVSKSVGYTSLMKPGIFSCKYCSTSYPNRFSLIKHETSHLKIVNRFTFTLCLQCDKYMMNDTDVLNRHRAIFHKNDAVLRKCRTRTCERCHLKFRKYKRHMRNYHEHESHKCGIDFNSAKQYSDNIEQQAYHDKQLVEHCEQNVDNCKRNVNHCEQDLDKKCRNVFKTTIIRVCDLCYSFLKRTTHIKYYLKGETDDQLGVRYPCDVCRKQYFVLKLVKRIQKCRRNRGYHRKKDLIGQNEHRLKNIQHRLKKLNLLNKFYFVV